MPKRPPNLEVELTLFTLTVATMAIGICMGGVTSNNEHLWWHNCTQVFTHFLTLFSEKYEKNREQVLKRETEITTQMDALYRTGQESLKQGDYLAAADCFERSARMFKSYYKEEDPELLTDLYAQCIYNQALCLYRLRKYEKAHKLIEDLLKEKPKLEAITVKTALHNLNGLLCFLQYQVRFFEQEKPEESLLEKAKEQLQASYKLNEAQNDVFLMLQYLHGNMPLLVERQPFQMLAPLQKKAGASLPLVLQGDSLFYHIIYFAVAEAHAFQKKWREAIYLFEQYLENVPSGTGPQALFDQFITRFNCLVVYREYLAVFPAANAQYELLDNVLVPQEQGGPVPQQMQLVNRLRSKAEVTKRATDIAFCAKSFLDGRIPGGLPPGYAKAYAMLEKEAKVIDPRLAEQFCRPSEPVSAAHPAHSPWFNRFFEQVVVGQRGSYSLVPG